MPMSLPYSPSDASALQASLSGNGGAGLVGTTSGGTVAEVIAPVTIQSGTHSDGTNTIVGSTRWQIGNGTFSDDDSQILINRSLTGSYYAGAHGGRDESSINFSGGGLLGYANWDAIATATGSAAYNHINGFQARQGYTGSGSMGAMNGFTFQPHINGSGTVTNAYGLHVSDATGTGAVTTFYGVYIDPLTRATNKFSMYSQGASAQFYNAGIGQFGSSLTIGGAFSGATTGAFSGQVTAKSTDSTGTVSSFSSGGAVGVYYSGTGTGVIRAYANASGTGTAQLNVMGGSTLVAQATSAGAFLPGVDGTTTLGNVSWRWGNIFANYVKMTPTTVASLTAANTAGAGARAFVSDANATTFASIVAGGGANNVPVYSDGTNWRIG